jgi:DNA-binding LacI/PurR family transcriptional regulator
LAVVQCSVITVDDTTSGKYNCFQLLDITIPVLQIGYKLVEQL